MLILLGTTEVRKILILTAGNCPRRLPAHSTGNETVSFLQLPAITSLSRFLEFVLLHHPRVRRLQDTLDKRSAARNLPTRALPTVVATAPKTIPWPNGLALDPPNSGLRRIVNAHA